MTFPDLPSDESSAPAVVFHAVAVRLPAWLKTSAGPLADWLAAVAKTYETSLASVSYVLCDDAYLHEMNVSRLGHDTLTDIITFDLSDGPDSPIEGECYISLPRVEENAATYLAAPNDLDPVEDELLRVCVHGLLHLCGLRDGSPSEANEMRTAEDRALYIWRARFAAGSLAE